LLSVSNGLIRISPGSPENPAPVASEIGVGNCARRNGFSSVS
jgi:hypothetical protein